MKYLKYLLFLLVIPIFVSAKMSSIEVLDISMEEKNGNVEIIEKETIENSRINFNLKFYEVGDYISYKVKIKNITGSDINISVGEDELKSKYLAYEAKLPDIKVLKDKEEVELTLSISFFNNLEREDIKSGKYVEEQNININIVNGELLISSDEINNDDSGEESTEQTNPLTSDFIIIISLLCISSFIYIKVKKNKKISKFMKKLTKYSIFLLLLIPVFSAAVSGIKVNSYIEVRLVKPNPCTYEGELVNGAMYEKEQYEYVYEEELGGWRLSLKDRLSTEPVTSKICTVINGKPIVSMKETFANSKAESIDLSSFDTSNVIDMASMFYNLENVKSLDFVTFDTTKVQKMNAMFSAVKDIEEYDLHYFETPSLKDIQGMFAGAKKVRELDLSNFDTSKVNSMVGTFASIDTLEKIDISNWNFTSFDVEGLITNITGASPSIKEIILDNAKFGNTMKSAFTSISNLEKVSLKNVDTSNVTNMNGTFAGLQKLQNLDVSDFDTSNVTNMSGMFNNLLLIKELDLSTFDTSNVTEMYATLSGLNALEKVDMSNLNFKKFNKTSLFYNIFGGTPSQTLKVINLSKTKYKDTLNNAFRNFQYVEEINMENADIKEVTDTSYMFFQNESLNKLNMSGWDTSNVTDMNHMFNGVRSLKSIDVSKFNVEKVTNMEYMFSSMDSLTELDVTSFKTHSLTKMDDFASYCPQLTKLDLSSFDTSKFTGMPWYLMYDDYNITEVNLSNWDMTSFDNNSNVMGRMLGGSSYSLAGGDYYINYKVEKIIARNVKFPVNMYGMFAYIPTLEEVDLTGADTTRTTSMRDLFLGAKKLKKLDLTSFDTSHVTNMNSMFSNTLALEEIDLSSFDISNVTESDNIFSQTGATIGYAKNQSALEFFTSKAPSTLVFQIK